MPAFAQPGYGQPDRPVMGSLTALVLTRPTIAQDLIVSARWISRSVRIMRSNTARSADA
jgi:hypothetical protein